jgi:hypothetical protein
MKHFRAFLFFCLFSCAPAFPQASGIIDCSSGSMTSVPAWIAPGIPQVVDQLSCGQMVSVIGKGSFYTESQYSSRPSEYVKIQIADKVAYVDAQYVKILETQARAKVTKDDNVPSESTSPKEEEEQEKWNVIPKDDVKLREEKLLNPMYAGGPSTFTALLSNNSKFPISHLRLLVRLYDCSGKPKSDYSNCEIIGEVNPVVPAFIPAGQTRRFKALMPFEATPRPRGYFAWGYRVLGVRAE